MQQCALTTEINYRGNGMTQKVLIIMPLDGQNPSFRVSGVRLSLKYGMMIESASRTVEPGEQLRRGSFTRDTIPDLESY